ncbi:hypothetical protein DCW30_33870 [Streptomyces alfalfae]|uniref:Probable 2-phosphosulfolactate phosphatase n=1 Tax=Streptomyces alfalfae TaxID=1642299 RepID=A0ABN4VN08_9ACTN|nr:2-phosphosulfolactate phosphatase [Streptomyces alfalfae]APY88966.1 hypothetical protein A7J05_27625 [Streptomyces alfalfae]AYA19384.1 hypothetical protein D3X13_26805 [Streptomyces fradiae]RXX35651.1 hypothetical protein DCW30_33870 [Streptomyces alfalfae]RZM81576.1 hypothetical protein D4104_34605 [Streptomyces alfalfae]
MPPHSDHWSTQSPYGVRCEWGLDGARRLTAAGDVACLVVVDVLSFTTAVSVAVDAGTRVFPYRWRDETAAAFAGARDAGLAVGRGAATPTTPWSLSPAALRAARLPARLVLPSPNGSTIAAAAADAGCLVVAGCLRNARAVGSWAALHGYGSAEKPLAVVPAGERWPDGGLRPALEDLLGAGAVISALGTPGGLSPEARAAVAAFTSTPGLGAALAGCASGRELAARAYEGDVALAAESDTSDAVPLLQGGAFDRAPGVPSPSSP